MDQSRRRSTSQDSQIKKISAIVQLDQRKSATLPELKVKFTRASEMIMKSTAAAEEKKEDSLAAKASPTQEIAYGKKNDCNIVRMNNSDDSLVIEKAVVMLENEIVSTSPVILQSEKISDKEISSDDRMEKPSLESKYTAIRAPPSPAIPPVVENLDFNGPDDQGSSYEVVTEGHENEEPVLAAMERPYQAPFARVTSLENASANSPITHQPLPVQESESLVHSESIKARVPEPMYPVLVEESHDLNEKPRSKEPKGFRKFLKFGRKSNTSTSTEGCNGS